MGNTCRGPAAAAEVEEPKSEAFEALERITNLLISIKQSIDGVQLITLVSSTGRLLAHSSGSPEEYLDDELMSTIATLKTVADRFGATLGITGSSVLHLEGEEAVFSLYADSGMLLCFYSVLPTAHAFDSGLYNSQVTPHMESLSTLVREAGLRKPSQTQMR